MHEGTTIPLMQAVDATGLTVYEFDAMLRDQAAMRLENLAAQIRRGHEAERDVDIDEYDSIVSGVRNQIESAQICTAHWMAEVDAEMAEDENDS